MKQNTITPSRQSIGIDEARSGVTGHGVRYVLAGSLALAVAAFVMLAIVMG